MIDANYFLFDSSNEAWVVAQCENRFDTRIVHLVIVDRGRHVEIYDGLLQVDECAEGEDKM